MNFIEININFRLVILASVALSLPLSFSRNNSQRKWTRAFFITILYYLFWWNLSWYNCCENHYHCRSYQNLSWTAVLNSNICVYYNVWLNQHHKLIFSTEKTRFWKKSTDVSKSCFSSRVNYLMMLI